MHFLERFHFLCVQWTWAGRDKRILARSHALAEANLHQLWFMAIPSEQLKGRKWLGPMVNKLEGRTLSRKITNPFSSPLFIILKFIVLSLLDMPGWPTKPSLLLEFRPNPDSDACRAENYRCSFVINNFFFCYFPIELGSKVDISREHANSLWI